MKKERIIVLGCGHSGTTLLSGLLYFNGYKMLSPPTYNFECYFLNRLNEKILNEKNDYFKRKNIQYYIDKLEENTQGKWLMKDPLLNYLIKDYDSVIQKDYKVLFIYREPGKVINHLFNELKGYMIELADEDIMKMAKKQWINSNESVLSFLRATKREVLLINYQDLLNYENIHYLEYFLGHKLYMNFVNKKLNRSQNIEIESEFLELYNKLEKMKKESLENLHKFDNEKRDFKIHKNAFNFLIKKYITKINRKVFFKVTKGRPVYLRKPYPNE